MKYIVFLVFLGSIIAWIALTKSSVGRVVRTTLANQRISCQKFKNCPVLKVRPRLCNCSRVGNVNYSDNKIEFWVFCFMVLRVQFELLNVNELENAFLWINFEVSKCSRDVFNSFMYSNQAIVTMQKRTTTKFIIQILNQFGKIILYLIHK